MKEIAKLAVSQNTGDRGLRSIIEDSLMDLMYKAPDQKDINKVVRIIISLNLPKNKL